MEEEQVYFQGGIYIRKEPFTKAELYSRNGIYAKSDGDDKVFTGMNDFYYLKISETKDGRNVMHMIGQRGINKYRDILLVDDNDIKTKYQSLLDFLNDANFVGKFAESTRKTTKRFLYQGKPPILVLYQSKEKTLIYDGLGMRLYSNQEFKFFLEEVSHEEARRPKDIYIMAMEEILEKPNSHAETFQRLLKQKLEEQER